MEGNKNFSGLVMTEIASSKKRFSHLCDFVTLTLRDNDSWLNKMAMKVFSKIRIPFVVIHLEVEPKATPKGENLRFLYL